MQVEIDHLARALSHRYTVDRELGRGGMAIVYLAEDLKHGRKVAIKVLSPELGAAIGSRRFLQEIEIAAQLTHPSILALHDSGEADGLLYYVMPYVKGKSLREHLDSEKQLPLEDVVELVRDVAGALSYAHDLGLVHRDVKPENILLAAGRPLVSDFGIARAIDAVGSDRLTDTGLVVGSPIYMSPEQASGASSLDGRSDVYSLGCVAFEMLGGEPPFTGPNPQAVMARHTLDPVPSLRTLRPAIPDGVEQAVEIALAKIPADRFATATAFAQALSRGAQIGATVPLTKRARSRRAFAGLGGAAFLAVATWIGWGGWNQGSTDQGELRVLAVDPPAGTPLKQVDLERGVGVQISVEQAIQNSPSESLTPELWLMVQGEDTEDPQEGSWRLLERSRATADRRLSGVSGTLHVTDAIGERIVLKVVLVLVDSTETLQARDTGYESSVLVEYPVVNEP